MYISRIAEPHQKFKSHKKKNSFFLLPSVIIKPLKVRFQVVTNKRIETRLPLFVVADLIKELKNSKCLGIYKEIGLKYNAHNKYLKIKLSQVCEVSFRLSIFLNFEGAKT